MSSRYRSATTTGWLALVSQPTSIAITCGSVESFQVSTACGFNPNAPDPRERGLGHSGCGRHRPSWPVRVLVLPGCLRYWAITCLTWSSVIIRRRPRRDSSDSLSSRRARKPGSPRGHHVPWHLVLGDVADRANSAHHNKIRDTSTMPVRSSAGSTMSVRRHSGASGQDAGHPRGLPEAHCPDTPGLRHRPITGGMRRVRYSVGADRSRFVLLQPAKQVAGAISADRSARAPNLVDQHLASELDVPHRHPRRDCFPCCSKSSSGPETSTLGNSRSRPGCVPAGPDRDRRLSPSAGLV